MSALVPPIVSLGCVLSSVLRVNFGELCDVIGQIRQSYVKACRGNANLVSFGCYFNLVKYAHNHFSRIALSVSNTHLEIRFWQASGFSGAHHMCLCSV